MQCYIAIKFKRIKWKSFKHRFKVKFFISCRINFKAQNLNTRIEWVFKTFSVFTNWWILTGTQWQLCIQLNKIFIFISNSHWNIRNLLFWIISYKSGFRLTNLDKIGSCDLWHDNSRQKTSENVHKINFLFSFNFIYGTNLSDNFVILISAITKLLTR